MDIMNSPAFSRLPSLPESLSGGLLRVALLLPGAGK
jgi:hypothetical protein